jgi:hypothetical protein
MNPADAFLRTLSPSAMDQLKMIMTLLSALVKQYKVWEDDYNAKDIFSSDFLQQKMDYIHHNPCQPHWNLTKIQEDYICSSARFYFTEEPSIIPIDDVREVLV